MMKIAFLVAFMVAAALALSESEYQDGFRTFMHQYKKSYHHDEFQTRYAIYKKALDFVADHNTKGKSYTVAINKFSDLTNEEFRSYYLGLKMPSEIPTPSTTFTVNAAPATWDWRGEGAVTGVKDQGQCGSCWAFSTTGSTEGCHFLATQKLVSLSEQNLVDCSGAQGNEGCDGGLMTSAMDYIITTGGIDTESTYPYKAQDGNCVYKSSNSGATLASYVNVNSGDEGDLQTKVQTGPTSVAIDASNPSFQMYSTGVYDEPNCSSTELDHGVLAVGWGTQSGKDYWIVKNSWGTGWGQSGYIFMSRNKSNQCGIATMATLPKC